MKDYERYAKEKGLSEDEAIILKEYLKSLFTIALRYSSNED